MNTHDIELPPLPDLLALQPEVFDRGVKVVSETWAEQLMQDYARASIEAYRKQKGVVVVTRTQDGEIVAVTRQDEEGRILTVIAEANRKRRDEPDVAQLVEALEEIRGLPSVRQDEAAFIAWSALAAYRKQGGES